MSQEIEIEFKNLLTKEEFDHLRSVYPFQAEAKSQINYYFETTDFALQAKGSAIRIRKKNDQYVLTLKEPHSVGILETHDILTEAEANAWMQGEIVPKEHTTKQLKAKSIAVENLCYYGALQTDRREIRHGEVLLVLDYSLYNNRVDYELELEANDEATGLRVFEEILQEHGIPKRTTQNKIERFFNTMQR